MASSSFCDSSLRCFFYFSHQYMIYNLKQYYNFNKLLAPFNFKGKKGELIINVCGKADIPGECDSSQLKDSSIIFFTNQEKNKECFSLMTSRIRDRDISIIENKEFPYGGLIMHDPLTNLELILSCDSS